MNKLLYLVETVDDPDEECSTSRPSRRDIRSALSVMTEAEDTVVKVFSKLSELYIEIKDYNSAEKVCQEVQTVQEDSFNANSIE